MIPTSGNGDKGSKSNSKKVAVIAFAAIVSIIIGVVLINSHQTPSQPPVSNEQPTEDYTPVDTTSASYEDVSTVSEETTVATDADAEEDKVANVRTAIKKLYTYAATHDEAQTSKKCLSEDFADWLRMLRDHDREYHSGEVGLIDYDIWTRAQDEVIGFGVRVGDVEFRKDYNDNEFADATVTLTSSGKPYNKVNVTMFNEEGDRGWVIDDINGLKLDIKTYLATD